MSLRVRHFFCGQLGGALATSFVLLAPISALAQDTITEKLQHGEINWTDRTVMATGSGAPDLKLKNVAQVRLNAERAAQLAAYRNVLEAIKGVRVTSQLLGGERLDDPRVKAQVEGIVRGCKTVDTRYFSDYGVDVVIKCPLDGALHTALLPSKAYKAADLKGDKQYTGLILDATSVAARPALAPRVIDAEGHPVYSQETVNPKFLRKHGIAAYFTSVDGAKQSQRVGSNPLILKVSSLGEDDADLQLSAAERAKLMEADRTFLGEGRVAIATGAGS